MLLINSLKRLASALALFAAVIPTVTSNVINDGNIKRETSSCKSTEFWYDLKSCCLPNGGPPSPAPPPSGRDCPSSGWYWHADNDCCVPTSRNPPTPTCKSGWGWESDKQCCSPNQPSPPKPSGHISKGWKRDLKSRSASLCPQGLDACPIGLLGGDYECIDPLVELEQCGGCVSLNKGQDCTAIIGAWNVGCEQGSCAVYTCVTGFNRAADGKSCIAL